MEFWGALAIYACTIIAEWLSAYNQGKKTFIASKRVTQKYLVGLTLNYLLSLVVGLIGLALIFPMIKFNIFLYIGLIIIILGIRTMISGGLTILYFNIVLPKEGLKEKQDLISSVDNAEDERALNLLKEGLNKDDE